MKVKINYTDGTSTILEDVSEVRKISQSSSVVTPFIWEIKYIDTDGKLDEIKVHPSTFKSIKIKR